MPFMEIQFNVVESTAVYNDAMTSQSLNLSSGHHHASALEQMLARGTTHSVYVTLHGHFYQPPRENPYLDTIERQNSAAPFHNWNERIYHECYRPNAFARILNEAGEVVEIVNNYEYLSFNIGPTLMRWLEQYDTEVYRRILEADRKSCDRLNGHGNAIAQAYNHIILPLANREDKVTQIRWGKADFEARFGRETEGMWLAEAAVDYATLEVLIEEGIKFIVLAPSQVERCRPLPPERDPEGLDYPWQEVGGGQIDPTRPYRCFLPGDESRYIDIFVYDGPISRDMGFGDVLNSSDQFADRIGQAVRGDLTTSQLISVATDGETFGHHKHNTEKALAYAFRYVLPQRGWTITNFAHYLSLHPPAWEVEIKSVTAWSCAHGVDRWQDNCGCGGEGGVWHQDWRRPLRDALDWLRDQLVQVYLDGGDRLFQDAWAARNDYVSVLLAQTGAESDPIDIFLDQHQRHPLSTTEQVDALRLLEMQRHALLMYTSCGWFFEELSRPEGVQILRYAARAIALAGEVVGVNLEPEFMERLALAASNVEAFKTGDEVYRQLVLPSQVTLHQVVAHYAMSSLFHVYPAEDQIYSYQMRQWDYDKRAMGKLTLAVGHLQLTADATRESTQVIFAVLHMGGWDFHCTVQPFTSRPHYNTLKHALFEQLQQASTPRIVLAMNQYFGDRHYGIQDLFAEDRHRLLAMLSQETLTRLDQLYTQVYRDNYSLLMAYRQDGFEGPQEVLMAAQVALAHRATQTIQALTAPSTKEWSTYRALLTELTAIAIETEHLDCRLNLEASVPKLDQVLHQWLQHVLYGETSLPLQHFMELLTVTRRLHIPIQGDRLQEQYTQFLREQWVPRVVQSGPETAADLPILADACVTSARVGSFLKLGQILAIEMRPWLALLHSGT
jgi:alpha-amylase/alpha-mannosidase (GH57 family)